MIMILLCGFNCMQASSRPSSVNSNQDSKELIEINEEYGYLLLQPKQQAVFFAIRRGVDPVIIRALLDVSVKNTPSPEFAKLMEQEAMRVYKADSPFVRNLRFRVSGQDGTRAAEREELRAQLEDIENS